MRTLCFVLALAAASVGCGGSAPGSDDGGASDMTMMAGDGGLLPLGATGCTAGPQCESGVCAPYQMGAVMRCTLACTTGQPAPQCVAPSNGTCNGMGYCKFN